MDQVLLDKLVANFPGKIVRKDLTKKIKEGANVPVYVLEYLLGMYASSLDEELVNKGVENVKNILTRNYVRPDEAEKIKAKIRENGGYTIIDKISVSLNERMDQYEAEFSNLGLKGVRIGEEYPKKYDRLLGGGIWCIVQMEYWYDENMVVYKICLAESPSCSDSIPDYDFSIDDHTMDHYKKITKNA